MTDWKWFKFRYVIVPDYMNWLVWDCYREEYVGTPTDALTAYREAIRLNEVK